MASIGVSLPLTRDSGDGFTMLKTFREAIKQNFKMLVLTSPGERVMEPEFGVGVRRFLFENFNDTTPLQIENKIREQVREYIPIISITNVSFDLENIDSNLMGITILFDIPAIAASETLQITI